MKGSEWNSYDKSKQSQTSKNVSDGSGLSTKNTDTSKSIERPLGTMESSEQLRQRSLNAATEETDSRPGTSEDIEMGSFYHEDDREAGPQFPHVETASNTFSDPNAV
jgi:hypothetical protein